MNPKEKGEITEYIIIAQLLKDGFSVSKPCGDSQRYDLLVDIESKILKIQCKTARTKDKILTFDCCSNNWNTKIKKSYKGEIDYFMVYSPDLDKMYIAHVDNVGSTACFLRLYKPDKNNSNIRWAKDYEYSPEKLLENYES